MLYNNVYEIDLDRLVVELMPTRLRKPKYVAFMQLLMIPFKHILSELKVHREEYIYKINHNTTVASIEKVLNDSFDNVERRIYLSKGEYTKGMYISHSSSGNATFLPNYTLNSNTLADLNIDFFVNVSNELVLSDNDILRLEFLTRYFALDDKIFKIKRV